MEQGAVEKKILDQCMREGLQLPKKIREAPELEFGLAFYYNAFLDLSPERPVGFGEAPIPASVVRNYGKSLDLDEEEMEDLVFHIRAMDLEYLKYKQKKEAANVKSR